MSILRAEDTNRNASAGWLGIKYFATCARDMNQELVNCGLLAGNSKAGYEVTPEGQEYSAGHNEWKSTVVDVLYEKSGQLRKMHDAFRN